MSNKQDGYAGRLDISTEQGFSTSFLQIMGLDTLTLDNATDLFESKVLEDEGEGRPEKIGTTRTISGSGFIVPNDPGQDLLFKINDSKEALARFRHYPDRSEPTVYHEFTAVISSISPEYTAEDKATFSVELGVHGPTLVKVGTHI